MKNKIGLLGGTFNPIHNGHIELGNKIIEQFQLNEVLYILSANPPHKPSNIIVEAKLRWSMLTKALQPYNRLVPCNIEMQSQLPSWTINTVKNLGNIYQNTDLYFISGSEGFLQIQSWKNYRELIKMLSFIVVLRDQKHFKLIKDLALLENLTISENINKAANIYIYQYYSKTLEISSTIIREMIKNNQIVDKFVPKKINKFVKELKLYEI